MDDANETLPSRIKGCVWEPYFHGYGDGRQVNGWRLSNGLGYVLPSPDSELWWVTWAHPDLCGRPGWHHHAFGTYATAECGQLAFEEVYALECIAGNSARCHPDDIRSAG
jgi:hypothetical protein